MKKFIVKALATVAGISIVASSAAVYTLGFNSLETDEPLAGASSVLNNYILSADAASDEIIAQLESAVSVASVSESSRSTVAGNNTKTIYDESLTGVVSAEGTLNIRKSASVSSDIVESALRGEEVTVIGEQKVRDITWYIIQKGEIEGYAFGDYIVFGDEAEEVVAEVEEANQDPLAMTTEFILGYDEFDSGIKATLDVYAQEVNYCLSTAYPEKKDAGDYTGMYATLVYLLENLQQISDIAHENSYINTYLLAQEAIASVESNRQEISKVMGASEEEMISIVREEAAATAPATEAASVYVEPVVAEAPVTEAPVVVTEAPVAETAAPVVETAAPVTEAPVVVTEAPVVETPAPTTAAPVVETPAPTTTAAPVVSTSSTGQAIADYATSWVGIVPYVWGGKDLSPTGGVDCSGFVWSVFSHFGLAGGYTNSTGQRSWGYAVDISQILPGDLVCYSGHVAIYIGNGQIVHAPNPGRYIEIGNLYLMNIVTVRRLY